MEGHITIYGEITPWQDENAGDYGAINLKSVMEEINSQSKADEFVMHIHSIGGDVDEAFAIFDALKASGKKLTASIEGMCASSATIIALAAEDRKMTENSQFMIHLPMSWKEGTADEMQKAADMLKEYEEKVLNLYVSETGGDRVAIEAMMKNETYLTSEQAETLGFITEMVPTMKAVARINSKNDTMTQMTAKELETKMDGWFTKLMTAFKKPNVKMITVTTADGAILDFGDAVEEESQIAVGSTATVDGSPASGDFVLTDGRTLVFAEGAVTEIKEAEGGDDVEALKAKLAAAEQKIAEMETAKATVDEEVVTMKKAQKAFKKQFKLFKKTMMSDMGLKVVDGKVTPETKDGEPIVRKLWKDKEAV